MILTYANGSKTEAFILDRTDTRLRVAVPGCDDPIELTNVHGTWVSEDCEPVQVQFAWQKKSREEVLTEADCVCSEELAARLLQLLWAGDEEDQLKAKAPVAAARLLTMSASSRTN